MLIPTQLRQVREKPVLTDRTHTHSVNMAEHTNTIYAWLCNLMKSSLNLTVLHLFCELKTQPVLKCIHTSRLSSRDAMTVSECFLQNEHWNPNGLLIKWSILLLQIHLGVRKRSTSCLKLMPSGSVQCEFSGCHCWYPGWKWWVVPHQFPKTHHVWTHEAPCVQKWLSFPVLSWLLARRMISSASLELSLNNTSNAADDAGAKGIYSTQWPTVLLVHMCRCDFSLLGCLLIKQYLLLMMRQWVSSIYCFHGNFTLCLLSYLRILWFLESFRWLHL